MVCSRPALRPTKQRIAALRPLARRRFGNGGGGADDQESASFHSPLVVSHAVRVDAQSASAPRSHEANRSQP